MRSIITTLSALLCLLLLSPLFPNDVQAAQTGQCGIDLTWTLDDNGLLTITGTGPMWGFDEDCDVFMDGPSPWIYADIRTVKISDGVTSIGDYAFAHNDTITDVLLPQGLTTIGLGAFKNCPSLQRVTLADGLTTIENYAFQDCKSLTAPVFPQGLISIGDHAFSGCSAFTTVDLPDSTTVIGAYAFQNCDGLSTFRFPEGISTLSNYVLYGCDRLTQVHIPKSVTSHGSNPFRSCDILQKILVDQDNPNYSSHPDGLLLDKSGKKLLCAPMGLVGRTYQVPAGITTIDSYAFYYHEQLQAITFPAGLTTIGSHAFYGCDALTSVTIPGSVTDIGASAFANDESVTHLLFLGDAPVIDQTAFKYSAPTVYHPAGDPSWNDSTKAAYGGSPSYKPLGDPIALEVAAKDTVYLTTEAIDPKDLTVMRVYDSGAMSLISSDDLTLTVPDMSAPGRKTITVSSQGLEGSAVIPVHDGVRICTTSKDWPVASHPVSETLTLTVPGADLIRFTMGDLIVSKLSVYDAQDTLIDQYQHYSGTPSQSLTVAGDTVKFQVSPQIYEGPGAACSFSLVEVEAFQVDHIYDETTGTCTICNRGKCPPHTYDQGTVITPATCQQDGKTCFTCVDCGATTTKTIPATDHDWIDASCTAPRHCKICSITEGTATDHDYGNWTADILPTCEASGTICKTCKNCGDRQTLEVDPLGHSYENDICTTCGKADPASVKQPQLELLYPSLSFEDEVFYNVYFSVGDMTSVKELGLMILDRLDPEATFEEALQLIPGYTTNGSVFLVRTTGICAADLGRAVYFRIYARLADGSYAYSEPGGYHAKTYATSVLNDPDKPESLRALVVAMLEYGAQAQSYFQSSDLPINSILTSEQKALISDYDSTMITPVVMPDSTKTGAFHRNNNDFRKLYPSVSFDEAFAINFYCAPAIEVADTMTLYWWDVDTMGAVQALTTENAAGSMEMTANGDLWWGNVAGIPARDIDKTFYISCVFQSNGQTVTSGIIPYSLGKYCLSKAETADDPLQDFAKATAVYGHYAKQHFSKND